MRETGPFQPGRGGRELSESQLNTSNRTDNGVKQLDAFAHRYSEAVRHLRRRTHSSLWDNSKSTRNAGQKKKKLDVNSVT